MPDEKKNTAPQTPEVDEAVRNRAYEMAESPKYQLLFDADATDPDALNEEMAKPADQRRYYKELSDEDYKAWKWGWENGILDEDFEEDLSGEDFKANDAYEPVYGYDRAVPVYKRMTPERKAERKAKAEAFAAQRAEEERKRQEQEARTQRRKENIGRAKAMFGLK